MSHPHIGGNRNDFNGSGQEISWIYLSGENVEADCILFFFCFWIGLGCAGSRVMMLRTVFRAEDYSDERNSRRQACCDGLTGFMHSRARTDCPTIVGFAIRWVEISKTHSWRRIEKMHFLVIQKRDSVERGASERNECRKESMLRRTFLFRASEIGQEDVCTLQSFSPTFNAPMLTTTSSCPRALVPLIWQIEMPYRSLVRQHD